MNYEKDKYELTNQQKNIYLLDKVYNNSGINNIISWLEINDIIDIKLLEKTANIIVQKNDNYRLNFFLEDKNPYQILTKYLHFDVEVINVKDINELEIKLKNTRINLAKDEPFKFYIFLYPNGKGGLSGVFHHLISDAWTMNILIKEIVKYYNALKNSLVIDMTDNPSYIEYIEEQKKLMQSDKKDKNQAYWNELYSKPVDIVSFKEKDNIGIDFMRKEYDIPKSLLESIRSFCKDNKISEYIFVLSVFCIYIGRIKNANRFIIGNPILNRSNIKEKQTCGLFMSTNPFLVEIDNEIPFVEFAQKISNAQMNMYRHLKYNYDELNQYIKNVNKLYTNIYDVVFSYQNAKIEKKENVLDVNTRWVENNKQVESLMIHLKDTDDTGSILFLYDYLVEVFSQKDIDIMHERIIYMIEKALNNSIVKNISIVSNTEKDKLLNQYNKTFYKYDKNTTIVKCFEKTVIKKQDSIALIFNNNSISYKELNEKANQLANYLISKGIKQNENVAVVESRSIEMFISMLAILKCGCSYLPIDIEYPKDRIEYIIKNAHCNYVITRKEYEDRFDFNGVKILNNTGDYINEKTDNLNVNIPSSALAYIIYTSGSTGNPKGVMLTHQNVVNFILGTTNEINFENKVIVSVTTISFDIFVLESWLSLIQGCTIVIADTNQQNLSYHLNKLCLKNNVQMIQTTPSRMKILINDKDNIEFIKNMTDIMIGGEAVPYNIVEDIRAITNANIYNMYGPTETTVWSTIKDLTKDSYITIGKPIANTQVYVLDDNMNLCPIDVPGTLYIGGDGLAKGYFERDDLTKEKFIQSPFNIDKLIYNTGDIAKWNSNGQLICLGRNDFQVKIHGHRIELGEIESVIAKCEGINEVVVTTKDNAALFAFYTETYPIDINKMKASISNKLPQYMIPTKYFKIEEMPKTPNGKTDRKKLLSMNFNFNVELDTVGLDAKTDFEKAVCRMITDILKKDFKFIDKNIFETGMDSLNIIDLCNKITKEYKVNINVGDIFREKNVYNIAKFLENSIINVKNVSIPKAKEKEMYEATIAQQRIYFAVKSSNNELLYNMPYAMILNGELNISKLEQSINELIKRHVSLRIYFDVVDGKLYQKIKNDIEFNLEIEQIEEGEIFVKYNEFIKPFDFAVAPLFRVKLLQINRAKNILLFDMHHIISDGSSLHVLVDDVSNLYNGKQLENLNTNYIDFAEYENSRIQNNDFAKEKEYWLQQFEKEPEILNMPYDYSYSNGKNYDGTKIHTKIQSDVYNVIKKVAKENNVTSYILFLAIYYILLSRYTSSRDIVIGTPLANRYFADLSNVIGLFINDVPVRINANEDITFKELLEIVKEKSVLSFKNGQIPNGEIIRNLKQNGKNVKQTLFDTMFIFQNNGMPNIEIKGINAVPYLMDSKVSKYNFSMEVLNKKELEEYEISIEYSTGLFKASTMQAFAEHFNNILSEVLKNIHISLEKIEMIDDKEKNKLLYTFNNTDYSYDINSTIHQKIEKRASAIPTKTALIFEDSIMAYKEFDEKTNQVAHYLRNKGVKPNDIIGIMVPRSFEMLIGIVGVLKAGGSYMPIDISYPKDRVEYMVSNSSAKYILTKNNCFEHQNAIDITIEKSEIYKGSKNHIENVNNGEDIAYVIYTSGSTGNPKGVMVKHKGVTNLAVYSDKAIEFFKKEEKKNIVSVTTMSFDIFVFETLLALQNGLTVVIANEDEQRIPSKLNKLIEKNDVEIIQTTPSRMQMLIDYKEDMTCFKQLKYIVLIGEPFSDELLKEIYDVNSNIISYNTYGPTETTVYSSMKQVNITEKINIGVPIYNTQMYVLDERKRLVPINHIGELYIGGDGLSKGYKGRPELTSEKFIKNPYIKDDIIYATGDLVRFRDNGELECFGRTDNQVKIRGLRIELEEIEVAIANQNSSIDKVIVVDKKDKDNRQYLSAYFTSNNKLDILAIRNGISKVLPAYMIPTNIQQIKQFTYTPNGKIDIKVLKNMKDEIVIKDKKIISPITKIQEVLVKLYKSILKVEEVSTDDSFFDLGGDSILAMKLQIELIKQEFNVSYADIFNYPVIEDLEQRIINNSNEDVNKSVIVNDYSSILDKTMNDVEIQKQKVMTVLLTGATGFVGVHLLARLLDDNIEKVYCLIRNKNNTDTIERLKNKLHYYYDTKYDSYLGNKIIIINGNIVDKDLGLDSATYQRIANNIDVVINASAKVSHYGDEKEFNLINVIGVENLIDFCMKNNKKLFHLSTMSVSGNALVDQAYMSNNIEGEVDYTENKFNINQPLDNVYIKTKFIAEKLIYDNILKGLDAYVLRLGNIMGRYEDGKFQENLKDNAYINRLKVIYNLGVIPDYISDGYLEFTPVDSCVEAITKIVYNNNNLNRIFHLYNDKHITIKDFIKICEIYYKKISIVSEEKFNDYIKTLIEKNDIFVSYLLNDMGKDKKLQYESNIKLNAKFTDEYLKKIGFEWPIISEKYIRMFFDYLFACGFFGKEE